MRRVRVIPVLLIYRGGLYKTIKYGNHSYIGDPINTLKILNDKEVDEVIILDIEASKKSIRPNFQYINDLASECFMPVCYGGGIMDLNDISKIIRSGVEKVCITASAFFSSQLIKDAVEKFGSSSIVGGIDINKDIFGRYYVYNHINGKSLTRDVVGYVQSLEENGVGEILLNMVSREGTLKGYDNKLITKLSKCLSIPLVVCGGARNLNDFYEAIIHGASAIAASSIFVYHGKYKAVLVNYPSQKELFKELYSKL